MYPDEIQTTRLRLRRWLPSDREPFAALNADRQVMEYFPSVLTRKESDAAVDRVEAGFTLRGYGFWAVEVPADTPFIGFVGISVPRFDADFMPCVEIGWRLAHASWGKGYATEGAQAALHFAFEIVRLDEVVAFTAVGNHRSRRVMEKLGMTYSASEDFDHPHVPDGHPHRRHVLYRIQRPAP